MCRTLTVSLLLLLAAPAAADENMEEMARLLRKSPAEAMEVVRSGGDEARAALWQVMRDGPLDVRYNGLYVIQAVDSGNPALHWLVQRKEPPESLGGFQPPLGWWRSSTDERDAYAAEASRRVASFTKSLGKRRLVALYSPSMPGNPERIQLAVFAFDKALQHGDPLHSRCHTVRFPDRPTALFSSSSPTADGVPMREVRLYFRPAKGTVLLVALAPKERWEAVAGHGDHHLRNVLVNMAKSFTAPPPAEVEERPEPIDLPDELALGPVGATLLILVQMIAALVFLGPRRIESPTVDAEEQVRLHQALNWTRANFALFLTSSLLSFVRLLWIGTILANIALVYWERRIEKQIEWDLVQDEKTFLTRLKWGCSALLVVWTIPWWWFHLAHSGLEPEFVASFEGFMLGFLLPMILLPAATLVITVQYARRWLH